MGRLGDPRVDHVTSGRRFPLRRVTSGEEDWPWEGSQVGGSWFATASCELLAAPSRASPLAAALSSPVLENQEGWWVKVAELHLISTILQKGVGSRGRSSEGRRTQGDVYIDEGQCGSPEVSLDCQNFRRVIIRKYVIVRHPIAAGAVDENNKSSTAASGRAITPDGGIACELLE